MKDMRRLATTDDNFVSVVSPVTPEELQARQELYDTLTPSQFSKRLIDSWTQPVTLMYQGNKHEIQMNYCSDPFCRWFGQEQTNYSSLPYKPSRYKIVGNEREKSIVCNPDPTGTKSVPVFVGEKTMSILTGVLPMK